MPPQIYNDFLVSPVTTPAAAGRPGTAATAARSAKTTPGARAPRLLKVLLPGLAPVPHLLLPVEILLNRRIITYRPPRIIITPLLPLIVALVPLVDIPIAIGKDIIVGAGS